MDDLPRRRALTALAVLAVVGLVAGYAVSMRARPRAARISLGSRASVDSGRGHVYVHVGGAVRHPGLFQVATGARVFDAVKAAGGPTEDADLDGLNLASKVRDGDKILVPKRADPGADPPGAAPGTGDPASPGGLVNLNSATAEQLDALPGIGPAIAQRIIAYRSEHGGFRTVDELMDVPGIGPAKFEELKDHVTV